ncbi:uncharacterized protein BDZ99DRAFT_524364 [Mytilinidion resinicola]|uniref:Uncharacterized protein n=1 Tax=Mytilinidion resinicola TaxID=574789 RepID=A0A6A6YC03_9PEZI|nr:uncharacterized protein BDZ99DRAFT_524364 [Mytilinidion resinicola]KAF2806139.1 hypothetical protein BDZ99DRAFT_524364 [Mytilinidion resinicola]
MLSPNAALITINYILFLSLYNIAAHIAAPTAAPAAKKRGRSPGAKDKVPRKKARAQRQDSAQPQPQVEQEDDRAGILQQIAALQARLGGSQRLTGVAVGIAELSSRPESRRNVLGPAEYDYEDEAEAYVDQHEE